MLGTRNPTIVYDPGLPSAQHSIVDEVQEKKTIAYKQIAAFADIIELIAVRRSDPRGSSDCCCHPLDQSYNKVTSCRRKKIEDLSVFVSRFSSVN